MVVKSIIDNRRANRLGKYPIKILLSEKGHRKYILTGIYADLNEFDEHSGLLIISDKKTQRENAQNNNTILSILTQVNDLIMERRKANKSITPDIILNMHKNMNNAGKEESYTFNSYFQKAIDARDGSTKKIYENTRNQIEECFPGTLYFDDITKSWLKSFIRKMSREKIRRKNVIREGLSVNTQSIHLRNIRAVYNEAIDDKVASLGNYPFRNFQIKTEEVKHRAITVEDLNKIFSYEGTPSENWARDVAKLMFFLIGINAADLYKLSEINKGYADYRRSKTSRLYSIKVEPEALELIEQFKGKKQLLCFPEQFTDEKSFLKKINGKTLYKKDGAVKSVKRGLNTIGNAIGITDLTSYVFRHTWATLAAKLDIPKETIKKALGHGRKTVTDIYIDYDQSKIDEANRKVIDYVLGKNPLLNIDQEKIGL